MIPRRKMIVSLAKLFLSALLMAFALIFVMQGFGWFSTGRNAVASGQDLQTKEVRFLEIRASADGENIGVTVAEKNMPRLSMDDNTLSALRPGR